MFSKPVPICISTHLPTLYEQSSARPTTRYAALLWLRWGSGCAGLLVAPFQRRPRFSRHLFLPAHYHPLTFCFTSTNPIAHAQAAAGVKYPLPLVTMRASSSWVLLIASSSLTLAAAGRGLPRGVGPECEYKLVLLLRMPHCLGCLWS